MKQENTETGAELALRQEIDELKRRCQELKDKLADSEGTLSAIQSGEVDAIVVSTPEGERIFTLEGADEPYRILFEQMNEGALTTSEDGTILYCNQSFADLMKVPLETVIGTHFEEYLEPSHKGPLRLIIERSEKGPVRDELMFRASDGTPVPAQLSTSMLIAAGVRTYCMVLADLTERVHAEAELQRSYEEVKRIVEERTRELSESEARYRSIYENSRDAILLFDDQAKVVGANPAACQMFTVTDAEALAMDKDDIVIDIPLNRAMADRTAAIKGRMEVNYRRRWGGPFIGETTAARFTDADGSLITMLIVRDITDRKNAEAALDESRRSESARRAELEALVDAVPAMIWMSDGTGSVIISNETSGEILHQPPGSSVVMPGDGNPLCFTMFRDDQEVLPGDQPIQEVARTGMPCMETEFELRFPDGRSVWMYGNAVPLKTSNGENEGAIGAFIDITERKRAEYRLAEHARTLKRSQDETAIINEVLHTASLESNEGMYYDVLQTLLRATRSRFGIFAYIDNEGAAVAPTMTRDIWTQCRVHNKVMRFPRESWGDNVWSRAILQKRTQIKNETGRVPDGHIPITRVIVVPIIHQGEVIGHFEIANKEEDYSPEDQQLIEKVAEQLAPLLSERLRREEAEVRKQEALDSLSRSNAELQQFAYVASHDLQEPLRMVISYLGLLEKRYQAQLDDRGREFISIAVDGGRRMKALIDDLLEYSRVDTQGGDFTPVDMNEVVAKTLKLLEVVRRESGAEVSVGELPTIWGDQTQMIQVLQNLVGNAIKYRGPESPRISITASSKGKEYIFAIRDNGIGFKMDYAERIFQMFQRLHTREEYPGTGIGLAITKRIVERHGGRIWVESKEGEGSTFFFSLPRN